MQIERIGYLGYKLYSLGWHNALHNNPSLIKHLPLKIFVYYCRGFTQGSAFFKAKINSNN
ncbi:MAG: hypothetical protein ACRC2S_02305 [Waterburya sp.]